MEKNAFGRLILFRDNIYSVNWTSAQSFSCKFIISHKQNHLIFFPPRFACRLYSMVAASLAKVQQSSVSIAWFHFPWYLFSLKKCLDGNVLRVHHSLHHNCLGKNSNVSKGSAFLVTCCSLISASCAKGCLQAPHSFEPFCFPKILLLQILNCPKPPLRHLEGACWSIRPW